MKYRFDLLNKLAEIHFYFLNSYYQWQLRNPNKDNSETKKAVESLGELIGQLNYIEIDNIFYQTKINQQAENFASWEAAYKKRIKQLELEIKELKNNI